jgi:hypothetical protein
MLLINFLLFILITFLVVFVPGKLFIDYFKLKIENFEKLTLSLFSGISLFILLTYISSHLNAQYMYLPVLVLLNLIFLLKLIKEKNYRDFWRLEIDKFSLLIIALGILGFSYIMFFSGFRTEEGISFYGINTLDGVRHTAYIKNMINFFPPEHPMFAGLELTGFHYFYDFLLARFSLFFGFSVEDLYFRFFPPLTALLYGISFYMFATKITKNVIAHRIILFLAFFAQSFSFITYLFDSNIDMYLSAQPHTLALIINPFTVLAIGYLVLGLYLLPEIKRSPKYAVLVGLLFGVLVETKVYAGIMAYGSLVLFTIYTFVKSRFKYLRNYLFTILIAGVTAAITYLPNNAGHGGLLFNPFQLYRNFLTHPYWDFLKWDDKWWISFEAKDWVKIYFLYIQAFIFFWIYNLGILGVILIKFKEIFKKSFWSNDYNFLIFVAIVPGLVLMTFFLQSGQVFELVQFSWFILPLLSIPAGIIFADIYSKSKFAQFAVISVLVLFTFPGVVDLLIKYSPNGTVFAGTKTLEFYKKVEAAVPTDKFIIFLARKYPQGPEVSAFTGRQTYFEYGSLPTGVSEVMDKRLKVLTGLSQQLDGCNLTKALGTIEEIGSKFILTDKSFPCLATSSAVLDRFSSEDHSFYILK